MKRTIWILVGAALITLALTTAALAASAQDIYNDYAGDGQLTGPYTAEELQAYLDDATVHQYGDPAVVAALDSLVTQVLAAMNTGMSFEEALAAATGGAGADGSGRETFPFTGAESVVVALGGLALLSGGLLLRRLAR